MMPVTSTTAAVVLALAPIEGGLTTERAIALALGSAPALDRAAAELAAAEGDAALAFLGFVPRFDTSAGYARLSPIVPPPELSFFEPPLDAFSLEARVSIPATDYFLTTIHAYRASLTVEDLARLRLRAAREMVAVAAGEAFVSAIRARANRLVAERSVAALVEQVDDLERLLGAGLTTEGDTLQVKAQLASARVLLEQSEGVVATTREALRRTIHADGILEHGQDIFDASVPPVASPEAALAEALAARPDVRALDRVIALREDAARRAFGRIFPRLTLDGQATYAKPNQRVFYDPSRFNATWLVGVNLGWSPNDAVAAYTEAQHADQDVLAAEADRAALADAIAVEVTGAIAGLRAARASIDAAKEGLSASEGTFADRKKLLAAGHGTTRELLLSEQDLRRAELQLVHAHLDLELARLRMARALGRLVPEEAP
jgi:outer membrane protein TolC